MSPILINSSPPTGLFLSAALALCSLVRANNLFDESTERKKKEKKEGMSVYCCRSVELLCFIFYFWKFLVLELLVK